MHEKEGQRVDQEQCRNQRENAPDDVCRPHDSLPACGFAMILVQPSSPSLEVSPSPSWANPLTLPLVLQDRDVSQPGAAEDRVVNDALDIRFDDVDTVQVEQRNEGCFLI